MAGKGTIRIKAAWAALSARERKLAFGLVLAQALLILGHVTIFLVSNQTETRQILDFNQEWSIPTFWSAIVVGACGLVAAAIWGHRSRWPWLIVGLGLIGIGAEEIVGLHEHLDESLGIDWPYLYAPAMALGVWAIWRVHTDIPAPLVLVAACAVASMSLGVAAELVGDASAGPTGLRNLIEENLELFGSGALLVALTATRRTGLELRPNPIAAAEARPYEATQPPGLAQPVMFRGHDDLND